MNDQVQPTDRTDQSANLPIFQVQVKVCGLTNLEDALVATESGADLLGFIFYEKSPRYVDARTVAQIVSAIKDMARFTFHASPPPRCVGVFVNPSLEQVVRTLDYCGLDLAQLHGEEAPELLAALPGRAFKALRPRSEVEAASEAERFARFGPRNGPDLLVDAYHPTLRGGAGHTGDWQLAASLASQHRLLLAGGLNPDNVAAAVAQVHPWGVDVASGVEAAPGRKDHDRVRAFIAAARAGSQ
jgi:phosphoribosylanthranilate isomerase